MLNQLKWKNIFCYLFFIFLCVDIKSEALVSIVIYTENSPPFNFEKNGVITGSATEIVKEILKAAGVKAKIDLVPWARGLKYVQKIKNTALFATTFSAERNNVFKFKWVGPIAANTWILVARSDFKKTIHSLEDIKNKKGILIGTYLSDVRENFLKEQGFKNIDSVNDNTLNIAKLCNGRIQLFTTGLLFLNNIKKCDVKIAYTIQTVELYLAFNKDTNRELVQKLQDTYNTLKKKGVLDLIWQKWKVEIPSCNTYSCKNIINKKEFIAH